MSLYLLLLLCWEGHGRRTTPVITVRMQFADTVHGSPFMKKGGKEVSLQEVRETVRQHIGLETNGSVSTRHKYIVNIAKNLANDIDYKLTEENK